MVAATYGEPTLATRSPGTATTWIGTLAARSWIEATPSPADCKVASSCRFFISSDRFGERQVLDLAEVVVAMPAALRMARALSSVPDFGAPTDRRLPFRSSSVLMPESAVATIWMWLG